VQAPELHDFVARETSQHPGGCPVTLARFPRRAFRCAHDLTQMRDRSHIPPRRAGTPRPAPAVSGTGGAVAQLGERYVRNVEVRGSIPLGSTIFINVSNVLCGI